MKITLKTVDGRMVAAGRGLAGLTRLELAKASGVSARTIRKIESERQVVISPKQRHGCVTEATWNRIVTGLLENSVALIYETDNEGPGVKLMKYWRR